MKSMKERKSLKYMWTESFYGSATLGERGQIVIPAEARADFGFEPGDKLLIMRHPIHDGIMLFKIDAVREFLDDYQENLQRLADQTLADEQELTQEDPH